MTPLPKMKEGPVKHICENELRRIMNDIESRAFEKMGERLREFNEHDHIIYGTWLEVITDVMHENGIGGRSAIL